MWSKTDSNCLTMNEFSGKIRPKMGNTLRLLIFFSPVWFGPGFGDVVVRIKNVIPQADFLAASHQTLLWMNFSYFKKWSLPKDEKFSSLRIFKIILQPLKTKGSELRLLGRPDTHQLENTDPSFKCEVFGFINKLKPKTAIGKLSFPMNKVV